jgi:hypothetical protein
MDIRPLNASQLNGIHNQLPNLTAAKLTLQEQSRISRKIGQLHAHAAVTLGETTPDNPLDMRVDGPQSRSGRYGEVKSLDLIGIRTLIPRSNNQQVAIPTALSQLKATDLQK